MGCNKYKLAGPDTIVFFSETDDESCLCTVNEDTSYFDDAQIRKLCYLGAALVLETEDGLKSEPCKYYVPLPSGLPDVLVNAIHKALDEYKS